MSEPLSIDQLASARRKGTASRERYATGQYISEDDADRMALVIEIERLERNLASQRVNIEALQQEKSNLAAQLRMEWK